MLIGDIVYLTPLDAANMDTARRWVNDPEINRWMLSGHIPVSVAAEAAYYEGTVARTAARTGFNFEIHVAEDGRYIGNCGFEGVDMVHRHGELGIMIGETSEQNRGYGRDAIRTLLRFGFGTLGLHSVEIRHMVPNERGAHLYRSVGFKEAGILRQHVFLDGEWVDEAVLDMLESEWRALS